MAKRGQNEGSIYKRKDGRWAAVANLGYRNGKRWRKSFYGQTRKEVQERLNSALKDLQEGQAPVPEKQTVGQFLDHWLENSARQKLRPRTYVRYEEHIRLHIKPMLGHIKVSKLAPQEVEALLNEKIALGLAPSTVRYTLAILRRSLGQALRWGQVARNVATLVDPPRVEDHEIEPLNPQQAQAFLKSISGDRLEALYSVALAVGFAPL